MELEVSMNVFLTGATGFIGRALVLSLQRRGHTVIAWVRSPERARSQLGDDVELLSVAAGDDLLVEALKRCDGVINLAGEPLFGKRWTRARKKQIVDSRVALTARLVKAMGQTGRPSSVLVSASAVGYYGDRGDERIDEDSAPETDFLARLCRDWEQAALAAQSDQLRVVCLRIGIVFGRGGGAFEEMTPMFRRGVGGPIGSGRQYVPWIHLHDCVEMIATALLDERVSGPINVVGPDPIPNKEMAKTFGKVLRRPAVMPVPRLALLALFGKAAEVLAAGQRAHPVKMEALGFEFRFTTFEQTLRDLLNDDEVSIDAIGPDTPAPKDKNTYLDRRTPRSVLATRTVLDAPIDAVFSFFSKPANLGLLTPPHMKFTIERTDATMESGATIDYRLRVFGIGIGWRTRIECWELGKCFVDSQVRGPYRAWWHEHHFFDDGGRTVMEDRVYYAVPLGILGRLVNRLIVAGQLRSIFTYRAAAIRFRFGAPSSLALDTGP